MAAATFQPAPSTLATGLVRPYNEQDLLEKRSSKRQGFVGRSRSKTAPPAPPPEYNFFPIEPTAGIGESPRSSISSNHRHSHSQDRHTIGKILHFNNNNNPKVSSYFSPAMEDAGSPRSDRSRAGLYQIPVPQGRTKPPSPNKTNRESSDRFAAGRYVVSLLAMMTYICTKLI